MRAKVRTEAYLFQRRMTLHYTPCSRIGPNMNGWAHGVGSHRGMGSIMAAVLSP
jgi:hypothetical protein